MPRDVAISLKVHVVAIILVSALAIAVFAVAPDARTIQFLVTVGWAMFVATAGSSVFAVIDAQLKKEQK